MLTNYNFGHKLKLIEDKIQKIRALRIKKINIALKLSGPSSHLNIETHQWRLFFFCIINALFVKGCAYSLQADLQLFEMLAQWERQSKQVYISSFYVQMTIVFIFRISHIPVRVQISFLFHVFGLQLWNIIADYVTSLVWDPFINNTTFKTMQLLFLLPSTSFWCSTF